jgi:hypothetical protein
MCQQSSRWRLRHSITATTAVGMCSTLYCRRQSVLSPQFTHAIAAASDRAVIDTTNRDYELRGCNTCSPSQLLAAPTIASTACRSSRNRPRLKACVYWHSTLRTLCGRARVCCRSHPAIVCQRRARHQPLVDTRTQQPTARHAYVFTPYSTIYSYTWRVRVTVTPAPWPPAADLFRGRNRCHSAPP